MCFHITFFLQKICIVFWIYRMYCISYFRLLGVLFKDPILLSGWMGHALLYITSYMFYNYFVLLLNSVHVKYKIFLSAIEYLQFSPLDNSKGSFEEIVERYLYFFFTLEVGRIKFVLCVRLFYFSQTVEQGFVKISGNQSWSI